MPLRPDLLEPIAGENPGGVDLRYDPIYDQIKEARREDDDLPQGDWVRTRKEADWRLVERLAGDTIAKRSKDLRLGAWYLEACLAQRGAAGLLDGYLLIEGLLDQFWDHCLPEVEDGDLDLRIGAIEAVSNDSFLLTVDRFLRLNNAGHSLVDYRRALLIGTAEAAVGNAARSAARDAASEEGVLLIEDFLAAVGATPKAWYKEIVSTLEETDRVVERLSRICDSRFGRDERGDPVISFVRLRENSIGNALGLLRRVLAEKLQQDPDPLESEAAPVGSAVGESDGPSASGVLSAEVSSADDAAARVAQAARWMRQQDPTNPAAYLLVRGLRWGELRANRAIGGRASGEGTDIDPRLLVAPTTAVRSQLKGFALDGKWRELLEACETVMATPQGRGWLDLQRYALTAIRELGEEYAAVGQAIRGAVAALLRDRPALVTMTLMDDAPTANAETQAWLASEFSTAPEPMMAEPTGSMTGLADGERPKGGRTPFDRALDEVRAGSPQRAIELLMRELARERTPRGRFLRRIEIARIMVDAGLEAVAQPMLEELQQLIETHQLEQWEAGDVVAQPLALLYRVYLKLGWDEGTTQPLYLRIARLDPLAAMAVTA